MASVFRYKLDFDDEGWRAYFPVMDVIDADEEEDVESNPHITIPFGPSFDPLLSLTLESFFPSVTVDESDSQPMAIKQNSPMWSLSCAFHDFNTGDKKLILHRILERAVHSWVEAGADLRDTDVNATELDTMADSEEQGESLNLPGGITMQPRPKMRGVGTGAEGAGFRGLVDANDIADAVAALFSQGEYQNSGIRNSLNSVGTAPLSLSARMRSVAVPKGSFFWNLTLRVLDAGSPESVLRFANAGITAFLKGLWIDVVKELRRRWERGDDIPGVDVRASGCDELGDAAVGIDLRNSILHQKLQMLKCCIHRKKQRLGTEVTANSKMDNGESLHCLASGSTVQANAAGLDPTSHDSQPSTLVRLFDRLTSDEADASVSASKRKQPPVPVAPTQYSREGTSWNSERSWEDFSRRVSTTRGVIVGSEGVKSLSSNEEVVRDDIAGTAESVGDEEESAGNAQKAHAEDIDVFFDSMDGWGDETSRKDETGTKTPVTKTTDIKTDLESDFVSSEARGRPTSQNPQASVSKGDAMFHHSGSGIESVMMGESFITLHSDSPEATGAAITNLEEQSSEVPLETPIGEREGHKRVVEGLSLLDTGAQMWEPETQEAGYMTEDMLREQEDMFERLGTTPEAARLRARMQCAQLLSDMEAFKAANPGCNLSDFVRWHSPRDWVKAGDGSEKLSARMVAPGNLWQDLWKVGSSMPVLCKYFAQRLHLNYRQLDGFLQAGKSHCLITRRKEKAPYTISNQCRSTKFLQGITRVVAIPGSEDVYTLQEVIAEVRKVEAHLGMAVSLARKLPLQYKLVDRLLAMTETTVHDGGEREAVHGLFID
ncbi:Rab3 GTPase-activating protein catalytic subunit, partial [Borealophlyctis nickersoniae]